jgi:GNAT superfamily N-acetyltransferase
VGIYWIAGIEVDTMGVSTGFQRFGYGSLILTRAIETIFFQNPNVNYALFYCVGWNIKAQNFYKKYGMEISKQYKVPYNTVNPMV